MPRHSCEGVKQAAIQGSRHTCVPSFAEKQVKVFYASLPTVEARRLSKLQFNGFIEVVVT